MMPAITVHILQISKMNNKIYSVFKVTLITSSGMGLEPVHSISRVLLTTMTVVKDK